MSTKNVFHDRTVWRNENGEVHREDGPAVEYVNGPKWWYKNGLIHRVDGPAIEYDDGTVRWALNGSCITKEEHAILVWEYLTQG